MAASISPLMACPECESDNRERANNKRTWARV